MKIPISRALNRTLRQTISRHLILATAITALTACSSGGGGSRSPEPAAAPSSNSSNNTTSATPSTPPYSSFAQQPADPADLAARASAFEDGEYAGMGYLEMINASTAYARGATGAGVTVGVIDSGIDTGHVEFANGSGGNKVRTVQNDYPTFAEPRTDEAIDHGTLVAGVVAANRDGIQPVPGVSFNMHGVAFEADIVNYELPLGTSDGSYRPVDPGASGGNSDSYFASVFNTMTSEAEIINMSFGFSGVVTDYTANQIQTSFPSMLAALRQNGTSAADRSILVVAAGNAQGQLDVYGQPIDSSSPELLAGLPYLFPELQDHMLAVVAVGDDGSLTSYSNSCGVAASFCLAAPGGGSSGAFNASNALYAPLASDDPGAGPGDYYAGTAGTSFAAPLVSGSLALLKQMFPSVGNDELVDRLLTTANKNGIYADSTTYGQGLLDLAAATAPVGATVVPTSTSLSGPSAAASGSNLTTTGSAAGNSLTASLAGQTITVFDSMGFPFQQSALSLVTQPSVAPTISNLQHNSVSYRDGMQIYAGQVIDNQQFDQRFYPHLRDNHQREYLAMHFRDAATGAETFSGLSANPGWFFGLYGAQAVQPGSTLDDSTFAAPWLRFARNGWSSGGGLAMAGGTVRFGLFRGEAGWDQYQPITDSRAQGAIIEFAQPLQRGGISVQAGVLSEDESFLGINPNGALGNASDNGTWFSGVNAHVVLTNKWHGLFAWFGGMTNPELSNGLLRVDEQLFSSSFAVGINGHSLWQKGDRLGIYLSQPLRIERGNATLQLPNGRTLDQQVTFQQLNLNLEPSTREYRLEFNYGFNLGTVRASAGINYIQNPGHSDLIDNTVNTNLSFSIPIDL